MDIKDISEISAGEMLHEAVATIARYCMKHDCNECMLLQKDDGCFRHKVPCDWEEWWRMER